MGDINRITYVHEYTELFDGPFLGVGSKIYGSTQNFRLLFADKSEYIGVEVDNGLGVDIGPALMDDLEKINVTLSGRRFCTIICLSVLVYCEQPFKMADNLICLLKPRGYMCIGVPFSWKIHGYPSGYWRFTPEGVRKLFPRIDFDIEQSAASTSKTNEFQKLDGDFGKVSFSFSEHRKNGHVISGISAKLLKTISKAGPLK